MLKINVTKHLASFTLQFNHEFACEGITAILGVSGSGKSTLINMINGLIKPDFGQITLNDRILFDKQKNCFVTPDKRQIGTVFQDPLLFPHYKVVDNLFYGKKPQNQVDYEEIIQVLDIKPLLNRYPAQLSGGEKQRVAIGRAILSEPKLLLMDEPLSALDMPRKKELLIYIEKLNKDLHLPIIYVTHNINEVKRIADHVVILDQGKRFDFGKTNQILQTDYLKEWL